MQRLTLILGFIFLLISQSYGQKNVSTFVEYEYRERGHCCTQDSVIYQDSIDINPFLGQNYDQITIFVEGLVQSYRFDILLTPNDTNAVVTAYTYEIETVKPKKQDRKLFSKARIIEKREWKLKTKTTSITDTLTDSILSIINRVNFSELPDYKTMKNDLGLVQFDGWGFGFIINQNNSISEFGASSLFLNKHEKLINLKPIENILLSYIKNNDYINVDYRLGYRYNSRTSIIWIS